MDNSQSIRHRVRAIVMELAPSNPPRVSERLHLVNDLSFDSVALLELIVALETEFDLPAMKPEETNDLLTVRQLQERVVDLVGTGEE